MAQSCLHPLTRTSAHAGVTVTACDECPELSFADRNGQARPRPSLGRLFGAFDLVGGLEAVGAPCREVLVYRADSLLTEAALRVVEPNRWYRAEPHLWISHDGTHLLLAHDDPAASHFVGA